jgi:hypothetical protein
MTHERLLQNAMIPIGEIADTFYDLSPIPQNDGPGQVCVIDYSSSFSLAYNYIRAVWAVQEMSGALAFISMSWQIPLEFLLSPFGPCNAVIEFLFVAV